MRQIRPGVWVDDPLPGATQLDFEWNGYELRLTTRGPQPKSIVINGRRYLPEMPERSSEETHCEKDRR